MAVHALKSPAENMGRGNPQSDQNIKFRPNFFRNFVSEGEAGAKVPAACRERGGVVIAVAARYVAGV